MPAMFTLITLSRAKGRNHEIASLRRRAARLRFAGRDHLRGAARAGGECGRGDHRGHRRCGRGGRLGSRARPAAGAAAMDQPGHGARSEEHTSELQSLMRLSYAVFCFKKKNTTYKL